MCVCVCVCVCVCMCVCVYLNWRIIALQCYVGFCCTKMRISPKYTYIPGVDDGQGGLASCDSWTRKESDTTERLN